MSVQPENGRVGGQPTQTADYLLAEARKHRASLERLIMQFETAPHQIAAVDGSQRQTRKMQDFPVQGVSRYLVPKSGFGGLVTLVAAANTALLPINEARLGLQIINTGSAAVTIYLGAIGEIGVRALPQLWLANGGGSWDGLLSETVWCGNICAVAATGGTTVTIAEI